MKAFYTSRTFWVNALVLVASTLGAWAAQDFIQDKEQLLTAIVAVQSAVNIVLRFLTDKPIK